MTHETQRDRHLFAEGPKRILALDGGGIRGILSLQILRRIESLLRERSGNAEARLCDYFDLIGGTSTGAILAASLAIGRTVDDLERLYRKLGESIFQRRWHRLGLLRAKFPPDALRSALEEELGDVRMGDDEILTGLAIVAKRLDTGSPWVIHNNPRGRYFGPKAGSEVLPNKDYLVRNVVRASTAAPHYFEPEPIDVAPGVCGAFVDGGVSPHNNPALQLFLLATLKGHALQWPLGEHRLLLVSVGTGGREPKMTADEVLQMPAAVLTLRALASLMDDAAALNETLLQWFSNSPTARQIDREMGDLSDDLLVKEPLLTYLRYDVQFDRAWLERRLDFALTDLELDSLHEMDRPANLESLVRVGRAAAERLVDEAHFPTAFDLEGTRS